MMNKEELLDQISSKIRLKSNGYYFLSETGRCIEEALKLDLTDFERIEIEALQKRVKEVYLPHHSQFVLSHNEPVLSIIHELENILIG